MEGTDDLRTLLHGLKGEVLLALAAEGSAERFARMLAEFRAGTPAAYLAGFFYFMGEFFTIDARAYITDGEAEHLVRAVIAEAQAFTADTGRAPRILEIGTGAGTLALTVKKALPGSIVYGSDVDPDALDVAVENANLQRCELKLLEGSLLDPWPEAEPPDIVFADPPWGTREDLYDDERDAAFYDRMPELSAYPAEGRTALHEAIVADYAARGWTCRLLMNFGVIDVETVKKVVAPLQASLIHPIPGITVAICRGPRS
ncbi:MAG: methyltransferase [Verrucomicrobiota bacterium JB022]|nr:methyltransferase [Verrucomicrobiota bacterium JB022]